jgi:hypothetical protein
MLSIPLTCQNGQHWPCALARRLCPMCQGVHRTQVTLGMTRAEIKQLPAKLGVLVCLARSHHVQSSFGNAVWDLVSHQSILQDQD